jgi:purine-nucleoside phosphorylase
MDCDALYRETKAKVKRFREMGISAVEMEVASFYAVCNYRNVKGIAFLIVSDILMDNGWRQGFGTDALRHGRQRLLTFLFDDLIR